MLLSSDHIPQLISTFAPKGYKYELQTINGQRKREQTGIAINIVAVLQSLHHVHRKSIIGVATGDVGVVKSPPHTMHTSWLFITILFLHIKILL